jgi:hypothetical protein
MTTIDDQISAVRRARVDYADRAENSTVPDNQRHWTAQAAALNSVLTTLVQHKLALAVVEAARQAVLQIRVHGTTYHRLTDAIAAFDAVEESR